MGFDDAWQLDVNTATAVELMLMTTFLQNTKGRHRMYMHRCIRLISLIDDETEARLDAAALENQASTSRLCIMITTVAPLGICVVDIAHRR